MKRRVVLGVLGATLDRSARAERWDRWRPTVSLFQHENELFDRLDLLHEAKSARLAREVADDIRSVSPETEVHLHAVEIVDPWDLEDAYGALHEFARAYPFDTDRNDYFLHITTGTHVVQICLFLLAESRHFPATLLQSAPPSKKQLGRQPGSLRFIDLDLSRYDRIAERFHDEQIEGRNFLKSGIETRSSAFNEVIEQIEHVTIHSTDPLLLMGPTGAGKSQLARRVYELKKSRRQVQGTFVEVNCATVRGDAAMSTLFGHTRGAFTGATGARAGLLREADGGLLFLDEIGELGADEQAMLLRAVEEKSFLPLGSDAPVRSDFQLICGTNRDLHDEVRAGRFRDDLLARIHFWTFRLRPLRERREDIEPNLEYELQQLESRTGRRVRFNKEARDRFLEFALGPDALWSGNFRDLNAAVRRMATFAPSGRINTAVVAEEVERLRASWAGANRATSPGLASFLTSDEIEQIDLFDRAQLETVLDVCRGSRSLSEAGRRLFAASRERRRSTNDADRLRKYLARFGLTWSQVGALGPR
ncbi:MAG: RNA repair transcriptional activator RtcR [Planctomycetota bacterium]